MAETPHTADRLRSDIDAGEAGDKKGFPDTAASPLGTDDEASGFPNSEDQVKRAQAAETENPARGDAPKGAQAPRPTSYASKTTTRESRNRMILIGVTVGTALVLTLIALIV
jgi:hypothetical protein